MSVDSIGRFEKANFIPIHVYALDENECVIPLRPSTLATEAREHVSLLFIENSTTSHYFFITDLLKLLHHCSAAESTFKACSNADSKSRKAGGELLLPGVQGRVSEHRIR